MPQQIDHVVILVGDLARASADYAAAGFTVTTGGEHAGGATHNALIGFADGTYLEVIAFREPERSQPHRWWPRLARGEGFVDYALLSGDLAAEVTALRSRGAAVANPGDGGRRRPDGQEVGWRNLMLAAVPSAMGQPFLIEDTTPRDLRVPGGTAAEHPIGAARVAGLTIVVGDLAVAAQAMRALLDDPGRASSGDDGERVRFPIGRQWLELLRPAAPTSEAGAHLARFGDCPFELILSGGGDAAPGAGALLPVELLHGARIRMAP